MLASPMQSACRCSGTYSRRASSQSGRASMTARAFPSHSPRRKSAYPFDEGQAVSGVVEEAAASSNGLFTDSFKNVLADALQRQGTNSLLQGQEKALTDEYQMSGQEDVLKAAIMASKSTLLKLQLVKAEVEKALETETKQVERLQFALDKARRDAAYYRTVQNMMDGQVDNSGVD